MLRFDTDHVQVSLILFIAAIAIWMAAVETAYQACV